MLLGALAASFHTLRTGMHMALRVPIILFQAMLYVQNLEVCLEVFLARWYSRYPQLPSRHMVGVQLVVTPSSCASDTSDN